MAAWIHPLPTPTAGGRIIDKSTAGTDHGYVLDTYPGDSLRFIVQRGALQFNGKLPSNRWVHVAATVALNGALALYVDGKPVAERKGGEIDPEFTMLQQKIARMSRFRDRLAAAGLADSYEATLAQLAADYLTAFIARRKLQDEGRIERLPGAADAAANRSYLDTASKLCSGLEQRIGSYTNSPAPHRKRVYETWKAP